MVSIENVGRPKQRMLGPSGEMSEISADLECERSGTFQDGGRRNVNLLTTIRVCECDIQSVGQSRDRKIAANARPCSLPTFGSLDGNSASIPAMCLYLE